MSALRGDRGRWTIGAASIVGSVALGFVAPSQALAVDVEISNDTAVQAYEVANPWGAYELERRRITESLGMSLYHLQGKYTPGKPDYTVRLMFRLDTDPGINGHLTDAQAGGETDYSVDSGGHYVPGLRSYLFDLQYAYVEGKNLAKGWMGFRLGRQYMTDVLGWWSFDGGLIRVTTPAFFEMEAYGGFEQRGGLPLSTSRFEAQGIWRGSHSDFGTDPGHPDPTDYSSFQFAAPAPAFGFAIESNGPSWIHGRFDYRRVYNTGESFTHPFGDPGGGFPTVSGTRISSDRLGYAMNLSLTKVGGIKAGFTYDLYNQLFPYGFAGIEAYLGKNVTIGADFDYFKPTFDADSIWNWFTHDPQMTGTGRLEARIGKKFDFSVSGGAKAFLTEGDPSTFQAGECKAAGITTAAQCANIDPVNTGASAAYDQSADNTQTHAEFDGTGQLNARYKTGPAKFELRSMAEVGQRGRRVGGDLSGEGKLQGGRWAFGGRMSVYNFEDPTRTSPGDKVGTPREATSFGYVLGVGWKPLDVSKIGFEWEHDMNQLVGQRFRVLGTLDVLWIK